VRPSISFLKVSEPKVAKNRVHLDVHVGGGRSQPWEIRWPRVTEAVERFAGAGATVVREDMQNGVPDHMVMADPEGNEFCVL
jgi:predicted enzyme related to lactoylglutathione lyase